APRPARPGLRRTSAPARPAGRASTPPLTRTGVDIGDVGPEIHASLRSGGLAGARELALEVLEGARDTFLEAGPRLPTEMDPGATRVERAALQLAGARRCVARRLLEAGEARHDVVELLHAGLDAGADVHQQAAALLGGTDER